MDQDSHDQIIGVRIEKLEVERQYDLGQRGSDDASEDRSEDRRAAAWLTSGRRRQPDRGPSPEPRRVDPKVRVTSNIWPDRLAMPSF